MNTKNVIGHISFLFEGRRLRVRAMRNGTFRIPVKGNKLKYKDFTAREVIMYKQIISGDPVLTLESGNKFRVFQGGDCSYLLPEADGLISKHDTREVLRREGEKINHSYIEAAQYEFPLGDYDL